MALIGFGLVVRWERVKTAADGSSRGLGAHHAARRLALGYRDVPPPDAQLPALDTV